MVLTLAHELAFRLLRQLAAHPALSGPRAASELGVTRAAVWEAVQWLRSAGVEISAVPGRGYRLEAPVEMLHEQKIRSLLCGDQGATIHVLDEVDSTNRLAMLAAARGAPSSSVFLAEYQTAGRGRRGRKWISPPGRNLYLSILWREADGTAKFAGLSLAVGVAVTEMLRELGLAEVTVKWPNDILVNERKLGGILIEVGGEAHGPCYCAVGVGLNLGMGSTVGEIDQPWADLRDYLPVVGRNQLAARLIESLALGLQGFSKEGLLPFRARWDRLDCYKGRLVRLSRADGTFVEGTVCGIHDDGSLILDHHGVRSCHFSGELSLRAVAACGDF